MNRLVSRIGLGYNDLEFIFSRLTRDKTEKEFLADIIAEKDGLDLVLDDDLLYSELVAKENSFSKVSPNFYFYTLVRHYLKEDFKSRDLADYISTMMSRFMVNENIVPKKEGVNLNYLFEIIQSFDNDELSNFELASHGGDYSLFQSGIFEKHIKARNKYFRRPVTIEYYETMGKNFYKRAFDSKFAKELDLMPVFNHLSNDFELIRERLAALSENVLLREDKMQKVHQAYAPKSKEERKSI